MSAGACWRMTCRPTASKRRKPRPRSLSASCRAARIAREQEVKVYTVGIGPPEGTFLNLGGRSIWVRLDEDTLREVAEITGGTYYHATSTMELRRVYRRLSRDIGWESRPTEVSGLLAGAGGLPVGGGVRGSLPRGPPGLTFTLILVPFPPARLSLYTA